MTRVQKLAAWWFIGLAAYIAIYGGESGRIVLAVFISIVISAWALYQLVEWAVEQLSEDKDK